MTMMSDRLKRPVARMKMRRLLSVVALAALAACRRHEPPRDEKPDAAVSIVVHAAEPPAAGYNVVLISIDTLRHDLGYAGYPKPITPHLDALAARSAVFERAYATASYTPKSVGPMLIGRYASETYRDGEHYTTFAPKNEMLAERVRAGGAFTLAAMCHHYFKWQTGFEQGFDRWDTSAVPPGEKDNDPSVTSDHLTDAAIALLDRELPEGKPFFAWFHYTDPHLPYVPHEGAPDFRRSGDPFRRPAYDGEVWFTDAEVGRLLEHIAQKPWAKSTSIIVTSDHGEAFGEHDFIGHGRELWEPLVRVPLFIHVPGLLPRRIGVKRSHIDLATTVLDLMGIAKGPNLRGKSLLPDVVGQGDPEERDVYMDMPKGPFNEARRAVIVGPTPGLKLIDFGEGRIELYDLAADPGERRNVIGDGELRRLAWDSLVRFRRELREVTPFR